MFSLDIVNEAAIGYGCPCIQSSSEGELVWAHPKMTISHSLSVLSAKRFMGVVYST
jgi:hypothetical protein